MEDLTKINGNKAVPASPSVVKKVGLIIDKLQTLRNEKKELEDKAKAIGVLFTEAETALIEVMESQGLDKATGKLATASIKPQLTPSIGDKDAMVKWAYDNDRIDIIQSRVNAAPVREMYLEQNMLPDGVTLFTKIKLNLRRR